MSPKKPSASPHRANNVNYIKLLGGDHLAALMLTQIVYWHTPDKTGKSRLRVYKRGELWLVKSHTDWWEELCLTRRQSQRCLTVLRNAGLIKTALYRYNGHATIHVQLIAQALDHQGATVDAHLGATVDALTGATKLHPQVQLLTDTTTETTTDTTEQALPPLQTQQTTPEMQAGNNPENIVNAEDILKAFKAKQAQTAKPTGVKALSLLWAKIVGLEHGWVKPATGKELGQLSLVQAGLGDLAGPVMEYTLNNWPGFAMYVHTNAGVLPAMAPHLGFFCKHWDSAKAHYDEKLLKANKQAQPITAHSLVVDKTKTMPDNSVHVQDLATAADVKSTLAALAEMATK